MNLRIGIHASIAGGFTKAVTSTVAKGCDCFQIFARNPRGWQSRPIDLEEIHSFRSARENAGLWPLAIHSVYLINLAAQDPNLLARSREAFAEEIRRALLLGADYVVVHPGSSGVAGAQRGVALAVESIRDCTRAIRLSGAASSARTAGKENELTILIENTAGQGSSIGNTFEQMAEIVATLDDLPIGVCLDTAHTFASGYDISTARGLRSTVRAIERSFGFDRVKLVHCNDSKVPLRSRVDRHQHIGLGYIGDDGFRRLTHNSKFRKVPFILETPVDKERGFDWNIEKLRKLDVYEDAR
jgi:deoxyribonuclease IV